VENGMHVGVPAESSPLFGRTFGVPGIVFTLHRPHEIDDMDKLAFPVREAVLCCAIPSTFLGPLPALDEAASAKINSSFKAAKMLLGKDPTDDKTTKLVTTTTATAAAIASVYLRLVKGTVLTGMRSSHFQTLDSKAELWFKGMVFLPPTQVIRAYRLQELEKKGKGSSGGPGKSGGNGDGDENGEGSSSSSSNSNNNNGNINQHIHHIRSFHNNNSDVSLGASANPYRDTPNHRHNANNVRSISTGAAAGISPRMFSLSSSSSSSTFLSRVSSQSGSPNHNKNLLTTNASFSGSSGSSSFSTSTVSTAGAGAAAAAVDNGDGGGDGTAGFIHAPETCLDFTNHMSQLRETCRTKGFELVYHYTNPKLAPLILKTGFRMSTQGQGDGGKHLVKHTLHFKVTLYIIPLSFYSSTLAIPTAVE
jgi:hypothetical protein